MKSWTNPDSPALRSLYTKCMELIFCQHFSRLICHHSGMEQIKTALVGLDPNLYDYKEILYDYSYMLSGFIGGDARDIFHPSQPFQSLREQCYDVLLNGGRSGDDEQRNLLQLYPFQDSLASSGTKVLRPRMLGQTFAKAFALLQPQYFRSCLNPAKLMLIALLLSLAPRDGVVLESGCYGGGTSILMGLLLSLWEDVRKITAIDTFEGMPAPTAQDGETIYTSGVLSETSEAAVRQCVAAHNLEQHIQVRKGLVQDVLPDLLDDRRKVSLALVDTDQYLGTHASLKEILPRLQTNGLVIVDDYCLEGVRKAIEEAHSHFQDIRGFCVTYNFYVLWRTHDADFLSQLISTPAATQSDPQSRIARIHAKLRENDFAGAERLAVETLFQFEDNPSARLYHLIALRLGGNFEAAMKTALETMNHNPSPEIMYEVVQIGEAIGHGTAATGLLNRLERTYPGWRPTWQAEFAQSAVR